MFFAEELAKLANLGIFDHDGSLLGLRGNHIVNRQARGGGNSNCRWAGILIVADHGEHPLGTSLGTIHGHDTEVLGADLLNPRVERSGRLDDGEIAPRSTSS